MPDEENILGPRSLDELRKKAHSLNCQLTEEDYTPREIEIIGYYLHRIAASYLSYFTHKEFEKTEKEYKDLATESIKSFEHTK
ncbi:MAG: hypothetical protein QHH19_03715 [Candidatus Thermoplasmatota archaeon]|jgi:hypothetical protein|nr:hypothetical protein [Candidatus Thermoplasmatota archaeon]